MQFDQVYEEVSATIKELNNDILKQFTSFEAELFANLCK